MLFVLSEPQRAAFWMKNCPESISAAYIDPDGVRPHQAIAVGCRGAVIDGRQLRARTRRGDHCGSGQKDDDASVHYSTPLVSLRESAKA